MSFSLSLVPYDTCGAELRTLPFPYRRRTKTLVKKLFHLPHQRQSITQTSDDAEQRPVDALLSGHKRHAVCVHMS